VEKKAKTMNAKPHFDPKTMLSDVVRNAAVLFCLSATAPGKTRLDKEASKKSDQDHGAVEGASHNNVERLPGSAGRYDVKLRKLQAAARTLVYERTTPWGNSDKRLLPNGKIMTLAGELKTLITEFDTLKQEMIANIPTLLAEAQQNIGKYQVAVPTEDELKTRYTLTQTIEPLPDPKNFNVLSPDLAAALTRQLEAMTIAATNQAKEHVLDEMLKVVEKAIERVSLLDQHNPNSGAKTPPLHDSVMENIKAKLEMFSSFNLENNPRWKEVDAFMQRTLMHVSSEDAKSDKHVRKDILVHANEAKKKLAELKDLLVPGF